MWHISLHVSMLSIAAWQACNKSMQKPESICEFICVISILVLFYNYYLCDFQEFLWMFKCLSKIYYTLLIQRSSCINCCCFAVLVPGQLVFTVSGYLKKQQTGTPMVHNNFIFLSCRPVVHQRNTHKMVT